MTELPEHIWTCSILKRTFLIIGTFVSRFWQRQKWHKNTIIYIFYDLSRSRTGKSVSVLRPFSSFSPVQPGRATSVNTRSLCSFMWTLCFLFYFGISYLLCMWLFAFLNLCCRFFFLLQVVLPVPLASPPWCIDVSLFPSLSISSSV